MNPVGWVQGLEGLTLAVVIAVFLFVEEAGVPIPFAPGDILLAIGGIAIAAGRVDPVTLVLAIFVATVSGAIAGREIFALVGWDRLMKVATRLRAAAPLERAAGLLQRSGWRGVFTARLIPGLRVETTRVAGVSRMPRAVFLAGLVPATVVYIAAFVGLGAAFGRPILALIRAGEHNALVAGLGLALAVLLVVLLRGPVQRTLATLAPEGWAGTLRIRTDSAGIVLIPACIGINFTGHALAVGLKLPLFLDSIGTILCAVIAGPWLGASVGFVSNLVSSNTIDPIASSYSVVSLAIGFAAGLWTRLSWRKRITGWLALWLTCFAIASLVSAPLNLLFADGRSGVPLGDAIYAWLTSVHVPRIVAAFLGEAAIDLPDKLITVMAALLIAQGLPRPRPGARGVDLDLREAVVFIFRTPSWRRKVVAAALCLLFSWLVIPLFWFMGYTVALARQVRDGTTELPPWDHLRGKLKDGFAIFAVVFLWNIPGLMLSIPAGLAGDTVSPVLTALAALGSLWGLLVLVAEAPIFSQYLQGGFKAAFNLPAIVRRLRSNLGLALIVGALIIVLSTVWVVGFLAVAIGALATLTYASWVGAYLVGMYAATTDAAVGVAPTAVTRPGAIPRAPAS